jgi:hypothetical protein
MQVCEKQKLSGSSFAGGYLSGVPAHFDYIQSIVIDTQVVHRRGFHTHVPACFASNAFLRVNGFPSEGNAGRYFSILPGRNGYSKAYNKKR